MSDSHPAMTSSRESRAWSTSGYLMLLAFLALLVLTIMRVVGFAASDPSDDQVLGFVVSTMLMVGAMILISAGFYMIQPN